MGRLADILKIRQGEGRTASLVIGVMIFTSAGFTLGNTGVEALFFTRYGVEFLPYMYMALGLLAFFITMGITALLGRVQHERLYIVLPLAMASTLVIGWLGIFSEQKAIFPALWLGMAVIDSLINLVAWGIASMLYDTRQSKRLFPLFNTGRIFGQVLGGFGTSLLVRWLGTENLILVMAGTLLVSFVLVRILLESRTKQEAGSRRGRKAQTGILTEMQMGYRYVQRSQLMRLISVSAILFSVLFFSLALPFSKSATIQFTDENALASFLGTFNALSTAGAFLASLFLANRLFGRFGIMPMVLILPVIYLIGFGSVAIFNVFAVIVAFRFIKMLWMTGIAVSAWNALFNTVPPKRRDQVRAFISGVPSQAGTFIAGAIFLVGEQAFSSQQLYLIGLGSAFVTCIVVWRAISAYKHSLVDALRAGQPTLFISSREQFGEFPQDATALGVALKGIENADPMVRRASAEILGIYDEPITVDALVVSLDDIESEVKVAALKALMQKKASETMMVVASHLEDQDATVRAQAIETLGALTAYPQGLTNHFQKMMADTDGHVRTRAAVSILKFGAHTEARDLLRSMLVKGDQDDRIHAIQAIAEWEDLEALSLIENVLNDKFAPSPVRRAAALALGACGYDASKTLLGVLSDDDIGVREGAAQSLGQFGIDVLDEVLHELSELDAEDGALKALSHLPVQHAQDRLHKYAGDRISRALQYQGVWYSVETNDQNGPYSLLADSLRDRAQHDGLNALFALSLLNDHETLTSAMDNLQSNDVNQRANAIEALETIQDAKFVKPIIEIWEPLEKPALSTTPDSILLDLLENEPNAWLRACAAFALPVDSNRTVQDKLLQISKHDPDPFVREVAAQIIKNGESMDTLTTLSIMERILLLRGVPLLADLTPTDLQRVAAIATEHHFLDGEIISEQDEPGDEMYVIVSGEVRVQVYKDNQKNKEVARRAAGETVGEMSVISGSPRSATLIAVGDVHLLCLDQKSFEGLLRERPEVSLAVMRMLCERLLQVTQRENAHYD